MGLSTVSMAVKAIMVIVRVHSVIFMVTGLLSMFMALQVIMGWPSFVFVNVTFMIVQGSFSHFGRRSSSSRQRLKSYIRFHGLLTVPMVIQVILVIHDL